MKNMACSSFRGDIRNDLFSQQFGENIPVASHSLGILPSVLSGISPQHPVASRKRTNIPASFFEYSIQPAYSLNRKRPPEVSGVLCCLFDVLWFQTHLIFLKWSGQHSCWQTWRISGPPQNKQVNPVPVALGSTSGPLTDFPGAGSEAVWYQPRMLGFVVTGINCLCFKTWKALVLDVKNENLMPPSVHSDFCGALCKWEGRFASGKP